MISKCMHGIIFKVVKDFVVEQYDRDAWTAILEEAGVGGKLYVPVSTYPDEEILAIVAAASELTEIDTPDLLQAVGEFALPDLMSTYGVHVDDEWSAIDLVANVETYIHTALREKQISTFTPPELTSERIGEDAALVVYDSERGLCDLATGLLRGVGEYYGEPLSVTERRCMQEGGPRCELVVRRAGGA